MRIEVVVPAVSSPERLLWSLGFGSRKPDLVTVVSNEYRGPRRDFGVPVRILRFTSDEYAYGWRDVALRRNIGIWESDADAIIFQDDDQVAPRDMVSHFERMLRDEKFVWGHHRFIDFDTYNWHELLDLPPEAGRSRETEPNRRHLYQSGYAGCLGIQRDVIRHAGGFDMMFMGRHGSEDQNLAFRLCGDEIFIHEPPFAWHPLQSPRRERGPTNVCDSHDMEPLIHDGLLFSKCSRCPFWKFVDRQELLFREEVVVPYEHQLVHVASEDL